MKISKQIGISIVIVVMATSLISLFFMNVFTHTSFYDYLENEENDVIQEVQEMVKDNLNDPVQLEKELAQLVHLQAIRVSVTLQGKKIFDESGLMGRHHGMMLNRQTYKETSNTILVDDKQVELVVGYYKGTTKSATNFINEINWFHLISFLLSLMVGIVATILISRHLAKPIDQVNRNLKSIAQGKYGAYKNINTNVYEMQELSISTKQIQTYLQGQDKMRKQMIEDIAHDLRTPLTVIKTNIEAMQDGVLEMDQKTLQTMQTRIDRVISIVGQLDTLNQANLDTMRYTKVNLSSELQLIIQAFIQEAKLKQITFESEIQPNLYLNIDLDYFNQIVHNLISNAIKYNNDYGIIYVRFLKVANTIQLQIEDTGIGISKEDLPFIYDRMYRCDKSRSNQVEGSGIGLSIVKSLVEVMDAEIEIHSELDKGTIVTVTFKGEE